jgi:hypothetical protein
MSDAYPEPLWRMNWLKPRLPWNKQPIKPAEIGDGLCKVMMTPKNILEDANYNKVLPNHYIVELSPENYAHHYKPLGDDLPRQWRDRLAAHLLTANSRVGRKEYRFGGQLIVELRSAADLMDSHARILCRVAPDIGAHDRDSSSKTRDQAVEAVFLELVHGGRRWSLRPGDNTIGRDETCEIFLDIRQIQEKRLVSAQHAFIRYVDGRYFLYDGSPSGKPSANGTFLNSQMVSTHGEPLQDGDIIILAAIHPQAPRLDTPGVAAFRFRQLVQNAD